MVTKTILKKSTGDISMMSFDSGEEWRENTSAFDTFAQIIEGGAEIVIGAKSNLLLEGDGIVIPAYKTYSVKAIGSFRMILTVIKSEYE
jgi:quercetin dioxygenase-like cupin family protein